MYIRRKNDGFSLMELIIATAILALLAGGIAAVFTGSMRAVRAGYQATSANEMARGALNVIERDLSGAFTSRDAGDYYQFFGTPIGMMFVGLVDTDEGTQLARVTYVLHHNAGSDAFETIDAQPVTTYSLVRLIEVGEEDLDSFPGPGWDQWEQAWVPSIDREYPLIAAELNAIRDPAPPLPALTEAEKTCLIAAKKRELWIRMLSGGELGQLPDAWAYIRPDLDPDEAPLDYIIAEHIVSDVAPTLPLDLDGDGDTDDLYPIDPDVDGVFQDPYNVPYGETFENPIKLSFFSYGRMGTGIDIDLSAYWNADVNFRYPTSAEFPIGHPMQPRLPEMVRIHLPFMYASTYVGAPDFTRILEQMIDVPSAYTRADLVEAAS